MTFQPGQSGNPAGRPRNKRTIIAEQLLDDHASDVTQAAIDLATSGHGVALRMCMGRIAPPLRHRLLDFALPELRTAADAVVAANAIVRGVARGEITIPEAAGLMKLVRGFVAVLAAADREQRIARLEARDGADAAREDDNGIVPAQSPPHGADEATTTTHQATREAIEETIDGGLDRLIPPAPSRPYERAHDRGARTRDQRKSVVPTATSAREFVLRDSENGCIECDEARRSCMIPVRREWVDATTT